MLTSLACCTTALYLSPLRTSQCAGRRHCHSEQTASVPVQSSATVTCLGLSPSYQADNLQGQGGTPMRGSGCHLRLPRELVFWATAPRAGALQEACICFVFRTNTVDSNSERSGRALRSERACPYPAAISLPVVIGPCQCRCIIDSG